MNDQEKRNEYLSERNLLVQSEMTVQKAFDQTLLLVVTGAIVLSVTFVTSQEINYCTDLLLAAWVFWVLTILLQIVAQLLAAKALDEQQVILAEVYLNEEKEYRHNPYNQPVLIINLFALACFAVGVVLFLLFITKIL